MQPQSYGFSNTFGQFNTQQTVQQGYGKNNNPFAPPSEEFQAFNQQKYNNGPQYGSQPYYQPDYPQPQNQSNQNAFQPYAFNYNNNDDIAPQNNNNWNNSSTSPADVFVGLNGQDDVRNRNYNHEGDYVKPQTAQADQNQDNKPAKPKPQKQRKTLNQYRRSISSWGASDCCGIITSILGLGSILVILILMISLMAYHFGKKDLNLSSTAGGLNYMVSNLNADPILELSWNPGACPSGTEKVHLGRWPGSSVGCNCPITGLTSGACTEKEDVICSDISDIDFEDMFRWEGGFLCAKRAQLGQDYVKATSCPTGFKSCNFTSGLLTYGICMKDGLGCPLSNVIIGAIATNNSVRISDTKYLSFSYTQGGAPIIDLDISINDIPCFSSTETPKGQGDYLLLDKHPNGCLTYGTDSNFSTKIDSNTQTRVIEFNLLSGSILKLPGYKKITDKTPSFLASRRRITVANNPACLALDTEIMNEASTAASNLNRYVSGTAITAMVLHSLLFILGWCGLCVAANQSGWREALKGENSGSWLASYVVITSMELIVFIVMKALVSKARKALVASQDYLVKLDQMGCFPIGPPKQVIGDYDDVVDVVASKLDSLASSLLSVTLVAYVPIIAIILYKKYKK